MTAAELFKHMSGLSGYTAFEHLAKIRENLESTVRAGAPIKDISVVGVAPQAVGLVARDIPTLSVRGSTQIIGVGGMLYPMRRASATVV